MSNAAAAAAGSENPLHVAIIMDGNGRWAAARGLPRAEGHRRGVIFSFSSENWSRPRLKSAICSACFGALSETISPLCIATDVRVRVIGQRAGLEPDLCALLNEAEELTKTNTKLHLVVAFNYGSRQEIANAAQQLAREGRGR